MVRFRHFRGVPLDLGVRRGRKKSRTKRRYLSAAERRLRMEQGAACPEAERPFASDAARLDHGPADAQPNAGAEEPPTSWREGKNGGDPEQIEAEAPGHCLVPVLPRRAKTSFKGREPLRCAPWLLPPGVFQSSCSASVPVECPRRTSGVPTTDKPPRRAGRSLRTGPWTARR